MTIEKTENIKDFIDPGLEGRVETAFRSMSRRQTVRWLAALLIMTECLQPEDRKAFIRSYRRPLLKNWGQRFRIPFNRLTTHILEMVTGLREQEEADKLIQKDFFIFQEFPMRSSSPRRIWMSLEHFYWRATAELLLWLGRIRCRRRTARQVL